jgi:regulator of sigma E protease
MERNGDKINFDNVNIVYSSESKKNIIGVTFTYKKQTFGVLEALGLSFKWLFVTLKQMIVALFNLIFAGKGAESTMGAVGIISVLGTAVHTSLDLVIQLGALISLNLAIINLMPFPALDGGRLVLLGLEKVRKKPLPLNIEGYMNFAGFVALMILMVILTYQDIARMISG